MDVRGVVLPVWVSHYMKIFGLKEVSRKINNETFYLMDFVEFADGVRQYLEPLCIHYGQDVWDCALKAIPGGHTCIELMLLNEDKESGKDLYLIRYVKNPVVGAPVVSPLQGAKYVALHWRRRGYLVRVCPMCDNRPEYAVYFIFAKKKGV